VPVLSTGLLIIDADGHIGTVHFVVADGHDDTVDSFPPLVPVVAVSALPLL
jgi:hypothetical protein